ncbi:MAG: UbiA family prenyltransferase [bacterium]|nr:UbiA family prenyltransferase [bacterium]
MKKLFLKIKAYLTMLRPEIAIMDLTLPAVCSVLATYTTSSSTPQLLPFLLAIIGSYCATVASYVANDVIDIDIDTINLPDRPLPSGKISRKEAVIYSLFLYLISLVIFYRLNFYAFLTLVIAIITITLYSGYLKRKTPFSFIPVGIAYGLVPIMVWLVFVKLTISAILFGLMICITDWGFTLSGVSRDVKGDSQKGAPTLPVSYGIKITSKFVSICWLIGIALSIVIYYTANLGYIYLITSILSGIWLLYKCVNFIKSPQPEVGGNLFLQSAKYRSILFLALIIDICIKLI